MLSANDEMIAISCDAIFDGENVLTDATLFVQDRTVVGIDTLETRRRPDRRIRLQGGIIAPAFVDLQVNGGGGVLFNNSPDPSSLARILDAHEAAGTCANFPTVISDHQSRYPRFIETVRNAYGHDRRVLGLHIEGPHFALEKRGAHDADAIRPMKDEDVAFLCETAQTLPLIVTLAPECVADGAIERLVSAGACVSIGHTNATYEQAIAAFDAGASMATHLYNAMSGFAPRAPGAVGAALDRDEIAAGIIADGHHVHPMAIRLAAARKPSGKLFLVSDAMATAGSQKKRMHLYGEVVTLTEGRLINADGALAGSHATLADCVEYAVNVVGLPLIEVLKMASLYPARIVGANGLGRISVGGAAEMVFVELNDRTDAETVAKITSLSSIFDNKDARVAEL